MAMVKKKSYAKAIDWSRKAVEQGHAGAQRTYYKGEGVGQDYAEAVKWCRKAAEQGNEDAKKN